jgi:hypothetical protein
MKEKIFKNNLLKEKNLIKINQDSYFEYLKQNKEIILSKIDNNFVFTQTQLSEVIK